MLRLVPHYHALAALIASSVPVVSANVPSLIPLITGAGGALVTLAAGIGMFLMDKIHTDAEFGRLAARLARTEQALEAEREAHRRTREALDMATLRADAAVRSAEVIARAIIAQKKGNDA